MGLDGQQLYVWEGSADRVTELIKRYVDKVGSAAAVEFDSDKPSPDTAGRTQREFTVSDPRNGIICVWEDGRWGDKKLARYLSKELETRSIWLALEAMAGEWGYVVYANGAVADSHTTTTETIEELETVDTTEQCFEQASEFARRHALPFALIHLPDPNMAAMHEQAKKAFEDLLGLEPRLEGRVEVEYDFGGGEMELEDLAETEAEVEAVKRQRAEVEGFPKLTIPCA